MNDGVLERANERIDGCPRMLLIFYTKPPKGNSEEDARYLVPEEPSVVMLMGETDTLPESDGGKAPKRTYGALGPEDMQKSRRCFTMVYRTCGAVSTTRAT